MPWLKVDDGFHSHPKVMRAGTAAAGLWVRCGSYVAQHLTDGFVPKEIARAYGTPALARALVDAGLWVVADGGWIMHDYSTRNPSRAKVEEERAEATERQRKARDAAKSKRTTQTSVTDMSQRDDPPPVTDMSQRTPGAVTVPPYPARTQPVPTPTSGGAELAPLDPRPDAGTVVAAYVDAVRATAGPLDNRAKGRIAKDAAALLADGAPVSLLIDAAQRLAANGYADLGAEARRLHGERSVTPIRRPSASEAAANAALEAGARVAARHAAQEGA